VQVGDLVRFNERALKTRRPFPNRIMLVLETSGWKETTAPTLLVLDDEGLLRRQYQHHMETINENR